MAQILSTVTGKVIEINITPGQAITEDDEAFVVEAMKMENVVYGEEGTVKSVLVNVGDAVEEDQPLAEVE